MQNKANLQDIFLLRAKRDRVPVTMFLMNGFQMRGIITGFDAFVVVLDSDGKQQMTAKDIDEVTSQVEWDFKDRENVSVEEIQDMVEQELMKYDFYDIAKRSSST